MAEKTNNPEEEEYQFSEVEPSEAFSPEGMVAPRSNFRRNIIILIGVVVVVFAVYKLLGVYFAPRQVKQTGQQVKDLTVTTLPTTQPATTVTPTEVAPVVPKVTLKADNLKQLEQSLEVLIRRQITTHQAGLLKVESSIRELQSSLSQLSAKLSTLNTAVDKLVAQQERARKPALVKPVTKRKRPRVIRMPAPRRELYYIQAIIPGRAWLKTKKGATLTVRIGSNLRGYGVVRVINPQRGEVITSSGVVIRYHPSDQ